MLKLNKGFTLIELLVVITIIGILATGATAVYTSQIQKARDTTRISDTNALKGGIEQLFQDIGEYPEVTNSTVLIAAVPCDGTNNAATRIDCVVQKGYLSKLPKDPKTKQPGNGSALDYVYAVGPLDNVTRQRYEISYGVESNGNLISKAANAVDNGNDASRVEIGVVGAAYLTSVQGASVGGNCTGSPALPNPSTSCKMPDAAATCKTLANASPVAGDASTSSAQSKAIFIAGACN